MLPSHSPSTAVKRRETFRPENGGIAATQVLRGTVYAFRQSIEALGELRRAATGPRRKKPFSRAPLRPAGVRASRQDYRSCVSDRRFPESRRSPVYRRADTSGRTVPSCRQIRSPSQELSDPAPRGTAGRCQMESPSCLHVGCQGENAFLGLANIERVVDLHKIGFLPTKHRLDGRKVSVEGRCHADVAAYALRLPFPNFASD